ncbi:hypothetical protein [Pararhodobacter sp.]|uniref:hypothetical protein n=1 Tax=Pararhodobacter sp. TaxID=2127056 RepID=UPI002AFE2AC6|nr:hypothetical protein [Pararhodobacter sp.]
MRNKQESGVSAWSAKTSVTGKQSGTQGKLMSGARLTAQTEDSNEAAGIIERNFNAHVARKQVFSLL